MTAPQTTPTPDAWRYRVTVEFDRPFKEDVTAARQTYPGLPLSEALAQYLRDLLAAAGFAGGRVDLHAVEKVAATDEL